MNLSGTVTNFIGATATTPGSITVGGLTLAIAPGTILDGSNLLGSNLNLNAGLNAAGQITSLNSIGASAGAAVNVCGIVSDLTAATATVPGSITVGGVKIQIAPGTVLNGAASNVLGVNLCLAGQLDASGQLNSLSSLTVNTNAAANVCGIVSSLTQATASLPGSITIGGVTIQTAPGSVLAGVGVGSNLCLNGNLNTQGQINGLNSITASIGASANLCGLVNAFTAATADLPGTITIGGLTLAIAPGTILNGQGLITVGLEACLSSSINNGLSNGGNNGGQIISGNITSGPSCQSLQLAVPLLVNGFTKTAVLKNGDLFLLPQPLTFRLASPSALGASIFPVNADTFGGSPLEIGSLVETELQGLAFSAPNATVRIISCLESFKAMSFEVASAGAATGDLVRLFLQSPDGSKVRDLALFTVQANGIVVTQLHPNVTLFRNNRLGAGSGRLSVGSFIGLLNPAGSNGSHTDLLTLNLVTSPNSPLNGCFQLAADITHGGGIGSTALVLTDILVNRTPLPGDTSNPEFGLVAGLGGGFPTGVPCSSLCPACPLACDPISISPTNQSFQASGGTGSANVIAPNGCSWIASSNVAWISITSGSSGSGNGAVTFSVAANTSGGARLGTLTIAGQTFTVTQQ